MKRCPECRRDYYDDTLLYCLDDGNALLEGPGSGSGAGDEPATAILHSTDAPGDAPTRAQINATNETAVLPSSEINLKAKGKRSPYLLVVGGLLVIGLVAAGWYFFGGKLFSKPIRFAKIRSEELFTAEKVNSYGLSADGKLMAYSKIVLKDNKSYRSMIVRQIQTGSENVIREIDNEKGNLWVNAFSPDGEYIYYGEQIFGSKPSLYRIPTFGGSAQKVLAEITDVHLSPDGKKIAYRKTDDSGNWADFYQSDINGNNQEEILKADDIEAAAIFLGDWSPDGTKLAMYFDNRTIMREQEQRQVLNS